jgi:hypothetical protein
LAETAVTFAVNSLKKMGEGIIGSRLWSEAEERTMSVLACQEEAWMADAITVTYLLDKA